MCTCVYAFIFVRSQPPFYRLSIINGEIGPKSHQFYPAKWLDFIEFSPTMPFGEKLEGPVWNIISIYHYWMSNEATHPIKRQQQQQPQPNSQLHRMISDGYPSQYVNVPMENHPFLIHGWLPKIFPDFPKVGTFMDFSTCHCSYFVPHRPSHLSPPVLVWRATETFLWCLDPISASAGSSVRAPLHRPPLKHPWRFLHPHPKQETHAGTQNA